MRRRREVEDEELRSIRNGAEVRKAVYANVAAGPRLPHRYDRSSDRGDAVPPSVAFFANSKRVEFESSRRVRRKRINIGKMDAEDT